MDFDGLDFGFVWAGVCELSFIAEWYFHSGVCRANV